MPIYIRVKQGKTIVVQVAGRVVQARGGDWINVGKQDAMRYIAEGRAEIPDTSAAAKVLLVGLTDCGIAVYGNAADNKWYQAFKALPIVLNAQFTIPYSRTLVWDGACPLRPELVPVGFYRLTQGWQLAIPLLPYRTLAESIGTEDERARTLAIIKDLRVPVYDTRLMYVQRCSQTVHLFEVWKQEHVKGDNLNLSFMRAAFQCVPVINVLPATWTQPKGR